MNLLLIRHGQTEYNLQGRIQGQLDLPLSQNGMNQVKKLAENLRNKDLVKCYSSDLKRAMQTAEIILKGKNIEIKPDSRLRERCYGEWEGKTWEQVHRENPGLRKIAEGNPLEWKAPGGESMHDVFVRIIDFLNDMLRAVSKIEEDGIADNSHILIVSHNSPIRALLTIAKGLQPNQYRTIPHVENGEIFIIPLDDIIRHLRRFSLRIR